MKYLLCLVLFALLFFNHLSWGTIYMRQEANGSVTYSDTPLKNGKVINAPQTKNSITNTKPTSTQQTETEITLPESKSTAETTTSPTRPAYTTFLITSPKDQATIQNQPTLPIEIDIQPALQEGDQILMLVDNKPWGNPVSNTYLQLDQLDRGTRQIAAVILDQNQKILKRSNTVTVYIHRVTLNSPSRPAP